MKKTMNEWEWERELNEKGWEEMILNQLKLNGTLTAEEISLKTGRSEKNAKKHLEELVESDHIKRQTMASKVYVLV